MLSKKKIALTTLAAAAGTLFILSQTAWSDHHYSLGGGWIGNRGLPDGLVWNCLQIPLDPAGKTGALRVSAARWSVGYADGLVNPLGGDAVSDGVGEIRMIRNNTAQWTMIVYEQKTATHSITAIEVYSGTWKFTGPDSAELNYTLQVYLPSADANGDGYPDAGATPFATIPNLTDTATRVPIL